MSAQTDQSNSYRGRYSEPVPTSNLVNDEVDFPEFEVFDENATPRAFGPPAGTLTVQAVDMCQQVNAPNHNTVPFDIPNLVVRRGQEFVMRVIFDRAPIQGDDFQVEFLIGANPSANKGSLVVVTFGSRPGGSWSGRVLEQQGTSLLLGVTPRPDAIVGKFRTYVGVVAGGGMQRTKRDATTDIYLLFNAWCPEDTVFVANAAERMEYVMNDNGMIYQGAVGAVSHRNWVYGQFERGILDACIYILDSSRMPIYDRGNVIKMVRMGSAMINAQDDRGVCVGNWSDDYSMGRSPTSWTGSVRILQEYANTGTSVCFAQCWVFAGVLNTFLRALGIPSRVITNFNSAHDNTGNLKTDLICHPDGSPDDRHTRDSIWNYHCWNEVCITRQDLPPGFGGWQVVDATPQETSDGHYRCGPAPVLAIKEGVLCHPYDCGFVFAEVNSDLVLHKRDRYGTLTPFRVLKDHIGQAVYTQAVGSASPSDITHTYKYPEGSPQDAQTMARAEEYGCARDHSELPESQLSAVIHAGLVQLGQDVNLQVDFENQTETTRTIQAHLVGTVIHYTGVLSNRLKDHKFTVTVPANQTKSETFKIPALEYAPYLGAQVSLRFVVSGQADDQSVTAIKVLELQVPELSVTVSGQTQVKQEMFVTVSFTNPFNFPLLNALLCMEGSGIMGERTRFYKSIEPLGSVSWQEVCTPRLDGQRCIVALMDCSNLRQVKGTAYVVISP